MNEESISNKYSPIDQFDSNDNFEMININSADRRTPTMNFSEFDREYSLCEEENIHQVRKDKSEEDSNKCLTDNVNEDVSNRRNIVDKTDLNDDISDDEGNFEKDDELDFEEGENSRGDNDVPLLLQRKKPAEDGEVNSEEELEDGEVKEEDSDEEQFDLNVNNPNKPSPANLNALCRFYSKGLCTWGSSCRFVHQKPIGTSASYSPKANAPATIVKSTMSQSSIMNKSNESLNQIKLNNNYQKQNLNYAKIPPPPPSNNLNNTSNERSSYYSNNQDQYRYVKKEHHQYPQTKTYTRSDNLEYDMQYQSSRNKYIDDRISSTSNYSRNTSSSSNYYTSIKPHHHQSTSSQQTHHPSSSSANYRSSSNSYESEYERKRRLAFESAPYWNATNNELNTSPLIRDSPVDRHSQSSGSKMYKHHPTSSSSNYVKKSELSTHSSEHYRDPWRRSKSPPQTTSFSGGGNRGAPHHQQSTSIMYSKSKSDSGSNFSNSESEMMEQSCLGAKSRRLDPVFANKHLPASFRESSNGETRETMPSYDHQTNLSNKKSYNYKQPPPEEPDNQSYHHHPTLSTAYQKSSTNTPTEMDIPNYERPKNLPLRTRKDSWSDSDSCSSSSNSSYSGSGASESDSNSDRDEPYSRTNKFESTREVLNEPQLKRQRTISSDNNIRLSCSKHDQLNKTPRSPYSPTTEFSSPSRYSSTGRKKHSIMNCDDLGSPSYLDDDELVLESTERTSQKKFKNNRFDLERNGLNNDNNDTNDSTGDQKKAELLHQLKAIEEAIARKRSKLK